MRYEGDVYRPPSEANSYILQVTIGCSHNKCSFCDMYKDKEFRIRKMRDIIDDLKYAKSMGLNPKRIFLADGDALVMKNESLELILTSIKAIFPKCERVSAYASAKTIMNKTLVELTELKKLGLKLLYLGVESGSDTILRKMVKGTRADTMIMASNRVKTVGIKLSVMIISGVSMMCENSLEHPLESARVVNKIDPDYLSLLRLRVKPETLLFEQVKSGEVKLMTEQEILFETQQFLRGLKVTDCLFRANHASNYVPLGGQLPIDRMKLISYLDDILVQQHHEKDQ